MPVYGYRVLAAYPHDPAAWTQGLVLNGSVLYEGTGLLGQSTLRRAALASGQVEQLTRLPDDVFGEGIAAVGDEIVQLTWKAGLGYVYDRDSFELRRTFGYDGEGWGLAYDGRQLVMSDGTATLRFLDPVRLEVTGRVDVADALGPVTGLNELEVVDGEVWANVWRTDWIVRIDPASGRVTGWIDLAGLLSPEEEQAADVLNGIAYDPAAGRLVVTGKRWPKVFEIELLRRR